MDVITIESKAYHELMGKIEKILRYVEKEEKAKTEYENRLVTNDELADILGISKRTLQRMRSADRISYKMIYGRCYYPCMTSRRRYETRACTAILRT